MKIQLPPRHALDLLRALQRRHEHLAIAVDEYVNGVVKAPAFGRPLSLEDNLARAARLAESTEYLDLAADPDFQDSFVDEMGFPGKKA